MECDAVRERLQAYLDGELLPAARDAVGVHLSTCRRCAAELEGAQALTRELSKEPETEVPDALWFAIERRLGRSPRDRSHGQTRWAWARHLRRRPTVAACILFATGVGLLGLIWIGSGAEQAHASTINFGIMLDEIPFDAQKAFRKFLEQYDVREASEDELRYHGRDLNYDLPASLPHGFSLRSVYLLRFGDFQGVAAEYSREDGEFLGAVFHPPVAKEDHGTHKDYPAIIGKHRGRKVDVGEWSLVHLTDPTTCHCVLSRLDEASELPAVMALVAPELPRSAGR